MLNFIARHHDDLILGFFFTFLGAVVGLLVASLRKEQPKYVQGNVRSVSMTTIIKVDNSRITVAGTGMRGTEKTDDVAPIATIFVLGCCFGYVYWRQEILLILAATSIVVTGFFLGSALYGYAKGSITGVGWTIYLILASAITIFSFTLVGDALRPTYAPVGLESFQNVLREQRIGGFLRLYGINTVTWLFPHVLGIVLFLYAQFRLCLSLAHYQAIVRLSAGWDGDFTAFTARVTSRYRNPIQNGFALILLSIASYFLVNGHFYIWYTQYVMRLGQMSN